jgi:hypothetical protein
MGTLSQELVHSILAGIHSQLRKGVLPVHNGHLKDLPSDRDVMDCLLTLRRDGLISGDLVTRGANNTPYRMTNLRLTYLGIKTLKS